MYLDPWQVTAAAFPTEGTWQEQMMFLLNYAVLAPSGHNTQPWLFRVLPNCVDLYADRRRALPVVDPHDRELTLSCGAALGHLRVAMQHFGLVPAVQPFPDTDQPDLLARIQSTTGTLDQALADLFAAIPDRHTCRQRYADRPLPPDQLATWQAAVEGEGAWLRLVQATTAKETLATLIARGDRQQAADPSFRRELAAWLHSNRSRSRDGVPGYAFGISDLASYMGPLLIRTFDWGQGQAAKDQELALGSPVLALLGTTADTPSDWLAAGQALARLVLLTTRAGVQHSYLNQPIEVAALRQELTQKLDLPGYPQLLLRLGYGPPARHTPRRPVTEVLLID